MTYAGCSDDEAICRNVIAFVEANLANQTPSYRSNILNRLEGELQTFLNTGSTLAHIDLQ
jgi:hypothetical protein